MTSPDTLQEPIKPLEPNDTKRHKVSIIVADGQALFRSGLVRILQDDVRFDVIAESGGPDVVEICATNTIDVLVTDLELGEKDGIELTRQVAAVAPATRVLILTSVADSRVIPALAAGATGFVLKDSGPDSIRSALMSVYLGDQVLCREAARWLLAAASGDGLGHGHHLTRRETDVVRLIAAGTPNKDIAKRLMISDKTVRNYVSRVYRKLALRNRSQIVTYAQHSGIAKPANASITMGQQVGGLAETHAEPASRGRSCSNEREHLTMADSTSLEVST